MSRRAFIVVAVVCACLAPGSVAAQVATDGTGTITGRVSDASSAGLPGVHVALSSDALMHPVETFTSDEGTYRFTALLPATYTLVFRCAKFDTHSRENVRVLLGHTVTEDVTLTVAPVAMSVTVTGQSSLLDRRSLTVGAIFERAQLAALPGARSMGTLFSATPSVQMRLIDIGGSAAVLGPPVSVYGISNRMRHLVEGVYVTLLQGFGLAVDYGSLQEVAITTAGQAADSGAPGLQTQFLVKSGGNRYHGSFYGDYEDRRWQAFNIDPSQLARDDPPRGAPLTRHSNRLFGYHDLNVDVGGFLKPDRAWWYASGRDQDVSANTPTFPGPVRMHLRTVTTKVTFGLTRSSQLVGFVTAIRNDQPTRQGGFLIATPIHESPGSAADHRGEGLISKLEWRSSIGRAMFVEARVGFFGAGRRDKPRSSAPRYEDRISQRVEGGTRDWREDVRRPQAYLTATFFRDGPLGTHDLKTGVEILRDLASETWYAAYPGGVLYELRNGQSASATVFSTPSHSEVGLWAYSAYVTDSWRVRDGLSLTLGVRFDRFRNYLPRQSHPAGFGPDARTFENDHLSDWNVVSPHLGFAQRLTRDGRTLVKASYATFPSPPNATFSFNANPNSNQWWTRYGWIDRNLDRLFTEDESIGPPTGRGGEPQDLRDPNLKLPYLREAAGWVERELRGGVAVRSGIVWRGDRRPFARQDTNRQLDDYSVPKTVRDRGPDGQLDTGDDGPDITVYLLPLEKAAEAQPFQVRNVAFGESDYWTWEISALKRPGGRWSLMASFSTTWNIEQASALGGQAVRTNTFPVTPNDFLHTDATGRYHYGVWSARVQATIEAPWQVTLIPFVRHQSGQPFGRTISETLNNVTSTILTEPIGTRRLDHLTVADVRVEKRLRAGAAGNVAVFVDVFNLFNANPEQNVTWGSGSGVNFLRPLSIVGPRIARVGVRVDW